jgi:hypothetical protein
MGVTLEKKEAVTLGIKALIVSTVVVLVVCLFNLLMFLATAVSGDPFDMALTENQAAGGSTLWLNANPRNNGFLGVKLSFELTVLDWDDEVIATNATSVYIAARGTQPFSLSLLIPEGCVQGQDLHGEEGYVQVKLTVKMLGDLVGFTNIVKVGDGR